MVSQNSDGLTGVNNAGLTEEIYLSPQLAPVLINQPLVTDASLTIPVSPSTSTSKPSYSTLRTGILRLTPESMKCKLYCRGSSCKYCSATSWTQEQQALKGIYSSWVTPDLLAMARPTESSIKEYNLINQLEEKGIKAIFNLQCYNEHSFCGPPLLSSGFTYDPEFFMKNKLYYYNFAIPDFGASAISTLLDIVKVMWFALKHGRVAVHCHAGLGRTGTLIACFLVWSTGMSSYDAVDLVRQRRPNSIQSAQQIDVVEELAELLSKFATALPNTISTGSGGSGSGALALSTLLSYQRDFLPNEEARKYSHVPKLLFTVTNRLLRLVFEDEGVKYTLSSTSSYQMASRVTSAASFSSSLPFQFTHNVRSCTFGVLSVEWKNAFTHKGRAQVRYVVNLLARLSAFPYDKDNALKTKFQQESLINLETTLAEMDASQLVFLMNACMVSIRRPYCPKQSLIRALEWFSPQEEGQEPEKTHDIGKVEDESKTINLRIGEVAIKDEEKTGNSEASKLGVASPKAVNLNANWHCMVFHMCNVLSYLTGENYDIVIELITYWLTGDVIGDVKAAVHNHMRDLYARNMRQMEQQAAKIRLQREQQSEQGSRGGSV
uniref:Uncharacterized protein n=1 Tax=Ditylenchus dipsaci TaxID=166011 RepID=A0A915EDK0_9BILA